ncbi:MAG: Bacterial regulatory protein luxR family [Planctomycetota bacterium]|jgi:DNA-binding CsgD family transcriptional regulator
MSNQAVVRAIRAPLTRSVLEIVRRFRGSATPSEIGKVSGIEFSVLRAELDLLEAAGLIGRKAAEGERREPSFFAVSDSVVITVDPSDPAQLALLEELDRVMVGHGRKKIDEGRSNRPFGKGGLRFRGYVPMKLTAEELAELKSIMHRMHRFFEKVSSQQQVDESLESQQCNYQALFDFAPAAPGVLPLAPISFVTQHEAPVIESLVRERRIDQLSPREKAVAVAMAQGSSRPEIAESFGISINTVASIGKRVYAKLGVSRRAELAAKLQS